MPSSRKSGNGPPDESRSPPPQATPDQTLAYYRIVHHLYAIGRGEIIFSGKPEEAMANAEATRTLRS